MPLFRVEFLKRETTKITFTIEAQDKEEAENKAEGIAIKIETGNKYEEGLQDIDEDLDNVEVEVDYIEEI